MVMHIAVKIIAHILYEFCTILNGANANFRATPCLSAIVKYLSVGMQNSWQSQLYFWY